MQATVPRVQHIVGPKAINKGLKDLFESLNVNGAETNLNPQTVANQLTTVHGVFDWIENAYAEVKPETYSYCGSRYPQRMVLSLTDWSTKRNTS